ncbi:DUF7094 domain-containing protein [Halobaculum sp. P14]|uniref:DUF7094 domain-containing protein n=1 Tax=Halobaculum sp. P14 TaxID=3421638 RepID=UPI003EBC7AC1
MKAFPAVAVFLLVVAAVGAGATAAQPASTDPPQAPSSATQPGASGASAALPGTALRDSEAGSDTAVAGDAGANESRAQTTANVSNGPNVSRILALRTTDASTIDVVTIDAGTATAFGTNASTARLRTLAIRERIQRANTSEARREIILDAMNEVEADTDAMSARQQRALEAYVDGDITGKELLVRLARIRAQSAALADRIRMLSDAAEATEDFSLGDADIYPLLYDLRTFDGPVRDAVAAALRGETAETRVYVAANRTGVVLTTIAGGDYVRETYRGDLRNRDGSDVNLTVVREVVAESYPEIWAAAPDSEKTGEGSIGTKLYQVQYAGGSLTAYVDGGTERIFREQQRIALDSFPSGPTRSRTLDLTVRVNRTYAGGPLRIAVVDPATGDPVNAVVKIGREGGESTTIGRTGDDGVLWTLSPRGTYVVTAVDTSSTDVGVISVSPTDPATVAEAYNGTRAESSG